MGTMKAFERFIVFIASSIHRDKPSSVVP